MNGARVLAWMGLLGCLFACPHLAAAQERSPFDDIRWIGDSVEVRIGAEGWFRLIEIDDVPARKILEHCRTTYQGEAQTYFRENLVAVLTALERPPGETVKLRLQNLQSNDFRVFDAVPMTTDKRERLWRRAQQAKTKAPPAPRARTVTRAQAEADLDQLARRMDDQWAYLTHAGSSPHEMLAKLRQDLPETVPAPMLVKGIARILARGGDAHSRVDKFDQYLPTGYLSFLVCPLGDRLVATNHARDAFVDPEHPYLVKLDGKPISEWLAAARPYVTDGSPALVRHRSIRMLRLVNLLREEMGGTPDTVVEATFANDAGKEVTRRLPLAEKRLLYGAWPRKAVERMGRIGYIRIPSMNRSMPSMVEAAFEGFDAVEGMIIDVRGNGGGARETLRAIWPLLTAADAAPTVVNIAQYRQSQRFRETHLAKRLLYPPEHSGYQEDELAAIDRYLATFKPSWQPSPLQFSPWHFTVLRGSEKATNHFTGPVVVLCDEICFSATDVFVAALKVLPHVTVMGLPTSGSSGYPRPGKLTHSEINVYLSSMVSYQPDGRLFDGVGVQPDIVVDRSAGYYIGTEDPQLDAARKFIEDKLGPQP